MADAPAESTRGRVDTGKVQSLLQVNRDSLEDVPSEIIPGFLYLGDADQAYSQFCLVSCGITDVINITTSSGIKPEVDVIETADCDRNGQERRRLQLPLHDNENVEISAVFPISNEFIAVAEQRNRQRCTPVAGAAVVEPVVDGATTAVEAGLSLTERTLRASGPNRVFVHCMAGRSRSVTLVVAYLLQHHRDSFPTLGAALTHVLQQRPIAFPNLGFLHQLQRLERDLCAGATSELPFVFRQVLQRRASPFQVSPVSLYQRWLAVCVTLHQPVHTATQGSTEAPAATESAVSAVKEEVLKAWDSSWAGPSVAADVSFLQLLCSSSPPRLRPREVAEAYCSLRDDAEWLEDLKIDVPKAADYLAEVEKALRDWGAL
eukprot:TRINITY_DN23746_c0_g1_i3.p1 TRINITY_DN23746_c0_g1~~TRINITY_DN23746_c0_g1_i3.p1  ORF type:complete len:396 (-),score=42.52 TRINITY_DN23746_c0_g1_i3:401-1528(-)